MKRALSNLSKRVARRGQISREIFYTANHQWVEITDSESGQARFGITEYGQDLIGDVIFVGLDGIPIERELQRNADICPLDSIEGLQELKIPLSASVTKVNEVLKTQAILLNRSAELDGWIAEIKIKRPAEMENLMTKEEYDQYVSHLF